MMMETCYSCIVIHTPANMQHRNSANKRELVMCCMEGGREGRREGEMEEGREERGTG